MAIYPTSTLYPGNTDAYPSWYARTGWDQRTDEAWAPDSGETWAENQDDTWEQS